jgi:hypothetical protein
MEFSITYFYWLDAGNFPGCPALWQSGVQVERGGAITEEPEKTTGWSKNEWPWCWGRGIRRGGAWIDFLVDRHSTIWATPPALINWLFKGGLELRQWPDILCWVKSKHSLRHGVKLFFFWQYWCLNSGLHTYESGTLPLKPCLQPSCSGYFGGRLLLFCSGLPRPWSSCFKFPTIAGMMGVHHHTHFPPHWDRVLQTFFPGCPGTMIHQCDQLSVEILAI